MCRVVSHKLVREQFAANRPQVRLIDFRRIGYSIPYQVPNDPEHIVARDDIMQQINSIFNAGPTKGSVAFRFVHLWGQSGTGKTTLAKHYIQLHQTDFSFVFWVWAESWETVAGSYLDFANHLVSYYSDKMPRDKVEERLGVTGVAEMVCTKSILYLDKNRVMSVVRAVKDWLMQPENGNWLVVFDGVEPMYNVQEFIPLTLSGRVILTSKGEKACTWGSKVWVHSMSEEQALELLSVGTEHLDLEKSTQGTFSTTFLPSSSAVFFLLLASRLFHREKRLKWLQQQQQNTSSSDWNATR